MIHDSSTFSFLIICICIVFPAYLHPTLIASYILIVALCYCLQYSLSTHFTCPISIPSCHHYAHVLGLNPFRKFAPLFLS